MNSKQKNSVTKLLYDLGKGVALAAAAGVLTGTVSAILALYCVFVSVVLFGIAYDMEGEDNE